MGSYSEGLVCAFGAGTKCAEPFEQSGVSPQAPIRYTFSTRYVYKRCMSRVRTNIEIEDTYLEAIMDRYGVRTKTEAVDLALRHLAGQPMSREDALAMRGAHAIGEVPPDSGPEPS